MAQLLTHINNTLRLIGEQPLLNSSGNLGDLTKQTLEIALFTVAQEVRHTTAFQQLLTYTIPANTPYLTPAFALPARVVQIDSLYLVVDTDRLIKLKPAPLEQLSYSAAWCVVGNSVYVGAQVARPTNLRLRAYVAPSVAGLADTDVVSVPDEVAFVWEQVAAALLAGSYLDDLSQASSLQKAAEESVVRLRARAGAMRAPMRFRQGG